MDWARAGAVKEDRRTAEAKGGERDLGGYTTYLHSRYMSDLKDNF